MECNLSKEEIWQYLSLFGLLIVLFIARLGHKDNMSNVDKFGAADQEKFAFASKANFNFYMIVALAFVFFARIMDAISKDVFLVFFSSILLSLGVKLAFEVKNAEEK